MDNIYIVVTEDEGQQEPSSVINTTATINTTDTINTINTINTLEEDTSSNETNRKRPRDSDTFSMGYKSPNTYNSRKIQKTQKTQKPQKKGPKNTQRVTKQKITFKPRVIPEEDIKDKENRLIQLSIPYNPIYSRRRIAELIKIKNQPYNFTGKTPPGSIKIILPNLGNNFMDHQAYWYIGSHVKTYFEWRLWLENLTNECPKKPKRPYKKGLILGMSNILVNKINSIYVFNQTIRWAFKNLCRLWLIKKSDKRKIGEDRDLITLETISPEDTISVYCIHSRCKYLYSGNTILKTIQSSLESQVIGIPTCKRPKNPFTNVNFTNGQLITLYNQIMAWCAKKSRPLPSIIALYREYKFNTPLLAKLQNGYLQYKATNILLHEDDTTNSFFLENLAIILEAYSMALLDCDEDLTTIHRYKIWAFFEPKSPLIKMWKQLIADYWYYEQTTILVRDTWRTANDIIFDIKMLISISETKLKNIYNEYRVRAFIG